MKERLNFRQLIAVASMLFGLFFGAGNLIFPVHLGQLAGSAMCPAFLGLLITAVVGFVYFYVTLPALNLHDSQFYSFLILLCIIYTVCVFLLSGGMHRDVVTTPKEKVKSWFSFVKSRCLPVLVVLIALLAAAA